MFVKTEAWAQLPGFSSEQSCNLEIVGGAFHELPDMSQQYPTL